MVVIKQKRNSGKTTILLHHMVADPMTMYVARTTTHCDHAEALAQELRLNIATTRFVSAGVYFLGDFDRYKVLVDDIDCITRVYPELGYKLAAIASVITLSD